MMQDQKLDAVLGGLEANLGEFPPRKAYTSELVDWKSPHRYTVLSHASWMLAQCRAFAAADREKLMRWIGFVQCILWMCGRATIDELREMNA